ncbi:hypothetical protein AB4254_08205 [Vibrio breoganii]
MRVFKINGLEFVSNKEDLAAESAGLFVKQVGGFRLLDRLGRSFAFVSTNESPAFIVTCTDNEQGMPFYMMGCAEWTEKLLGIEGLGYLAKRELAESSVTAYRLAQ